MILPIHITIAVTSLAVTGFLYFYPSKLKLWASYGLVALTLTTGFYLTWTKPAHLTQVCVTGLIYLGFVSYGIVLGRRKLVKEHIN